MNINGDYFHPIKPSLRWPENPPQVLPLMKLLQSHQIKSSDGLETYHDLSFDWPLFLPFIDDLCPYRSPVRESLKIHTRRECYCTLLTMT